LGEVGGRSGVPAGGCEAPSVHMSAILSATRTMKASNRHQMAIVTVATNHLIVLEVLGSTAMRAFSRHSAITSLGTILKANAAPSGTTTRSSRIPRTGMKSEMRSMGLTA
jgi:hypothetical protein